LRHPNVAAVGGQAGDDSVALTPRKTSRYIARTYSDFKGDY
jgi:hypothetical protein